MASLFLVYILVSQLVKEKKIIILTTFFYAFSASHFVRLHFLSAFQELGMGLFYFGSLIFGIKFFQKRKPRDYILMLALFILALGSKETAITFPLVLFLIALYMKTKYKEMKYLGPVFLIGAVYLYFRLTKFGGVAGESYIWDFSPRIFNTLAWYGIWSIGIPEMFLDFIGPNLAINPNLFRFYQMEATIIFLSFTVFVVTIASVFLAKFIRQFKEKFRLLLFGFGWFLITLLPLLFLPWHKFTLELTLPLFGVALVLASILTLSVNRLLIISLLSFFVLSSTTYFLTYKTHWVISRGKVAKRVIEYFEKNYPQFPEGKTVYFYNDSAFIAQGWGASKQIAVALSGSDALQVLYENSRIKVYYQDIDGEREDTEDLIRLGTKEFLGY